jgi:hypothetical protein
MRLRRFAAPLAFAALCLVSPAPAAAGEGTLWSFVPDADVAAIDQQIAAGYRLTEIETESVSPDHFIATFVRDAGTEGAWWWYHDLTLEEVQAKLAEHGARLTRLDVSKDHGSTRYAAVMIDNTGTAAVPWWWWIGSPAELAAKASELNARVIDLERQPDGLISAVMVDNSGGSAPASVYVDVTAAEIDTLLAMNRAQLIDIEPTVDGLYDVSMVQSSLMSWWYAGKSSDELIALANQNGARLTDVEPYETRNGTLYTAIMVTNVSAKTRRVNEMLRAAVSNQGSWGVYLKRVGGRQLSAINEQRPFEPASMIKVLYHLKAIQTYQLNLRALDETKMIWYEGLYGSCPTGTSPTKDSISDVLRLMMQWSDNRATQAILNEFGGFEQMNAFAAQIGALNTSVNHDIGCRDGALASPNQLTLYDAGLLYERASNGEVLTPSAFVKFRQLMYSGLTSRVRGIVLGRRAGETEERVESEAAAVRLSRSRARSFLSQLRMSSKGGDYTLCAPSCLTDRAQGGWVSIPFKRRSGQIVRRTYVFGMFTNDIPSSEGARLAKDRGAEILRPIIRRALISWRRARR